MCLCDRVLKRRQRGEKKVRQVKWGRSGVAGYEEQLLPLNIKREQEERSKGIGASTSC